jgi:hypothetical protein
MKFKFVVQLDEHEFGEFAKEAAPVFPQALLDGFKYIMDKGGEKRREKA